MAKQETGIEVVAQNRRERHDSVIEDRYEAGKARHGTAGLPAGEVHA